MTTFAFREHTLVETVWEPQGVYLRWQGVVGAEDIRAARYRISRPRKLSVIRYVINDMREARLSRNVDGERLAQIAAMDYALSLKNNELRFLEIAASAQIRARIKTYNDSGIPMHPLLVFATLDEARRWLATTGAKANAKESQDEGLVRPGRRWLSEAPPNAVRTERSACETCA